MNNRVEAVSAFPRGRGGLACLPWTASALLSEDEDQSENKGVQNLS